MIPFNLLLRRRARSLLRRAVFIAGLAFFVSLALLGIWKDAFSQTPPPFAQRLLEPPETTPTAEPPSFIPSDSTDSKRDTVGSLGGAKGKSTRDSLATRDTVSVKRDSTARVVQFVYSRKDSVTANAFPSRPYPLFLKIPSVIQRDIRLDSTGRYVIVREMVDGKDVKIPVKMPIEEYIKRRNLYEIRNGFGEFVNRASTVKKKNDLGELLGSFTNIDIPIPANPVFSIFGPPRINLHISGAVDIRAAFRNTVTDQSTISALGNSRNEPDFAQEVQINVSGTIGDKLNILADWNTQRTFEYENQLRIKYTGYEDEVVQSVEAGNVSLGTSSSFISSSSALFGIKAGFQFGPLRLTAIASQKKGQIKEISVSGGSTDTPFEKRAWEYSRDHFFVDTNYRDNFEKYYLEKAADADKVMTEWEVWVTHTGASDPNQRKAVAFIDLKAVLPDDTTTYAKLRDTLNTVDGMVEVGIWDKLTESKDYIVHPEAGFISFNRSVGDGQAIAIAYRVAGSGGSRYGVFTNQQRLSDSILVLKLLKPRTLQPQYKMAWRLMLKNIYSLGGRNIQQSGFDLQIKYALPGKEPVDEIMGKKLLQIFNLDRLGEGGASTPDNKFDYLKSVTIDESRGEIIFPSLEPFRLGIENYFSKFNVSAKPDSFTYGAVYDTTQAKAQEVDMRNRFIITGRSTAGMSNTYNLGFNIVENSVQVILNGNALVPNIDYTVDYIVGQVIIKNQAALVPGAALQIKFEQNDLFQLASKTLLGMRGDVKVNENTSFGFTAMNLNQQTLSDKVRLGEEPINNSIYGFDGQTSTDLGFLTKAIDALPFIDTKAPSNLSMRGEVAYMSPDPNTKKSPIAGDNGESIAYLDDFEGTKRIIPLGVGYGIWHDMSPPSSIPGYDAFDSSGRVLYSTPDTTKMFSKARAYWYNILPSNVNVKEIWPDKLAARGSDVVTVLNVNINPRDRGAYNFSRNLRNTLLQDPKRNWAGMQRMVSTTAVDLVRENVSFIELWVKTEDRPRPDWKIFVDLGTISEDVIPNRSLDTEDKERPTGNGILNETEDTGIDGLTDDQERANYAAFIEANKNDFPDIVNDPAGDDWSYSPSSDNTQSGNYRNINGTENNKNSEIGHFPDTEDLNRNGGIDLTNSYFEYSLDLTDPKLRAGGGANGWVQYRIPIQNFSSKVGSPDFSSIEAVRLWFTGFDSTAEFRITEFNLVGNQWEELKKNDPTFKVGTVSIEDNPGEYYVPGGVVRERDRTKPNEEVYANEQSASLILKNVPSGQTREAIKRFNYRPLDVFSYRQMRLFVNGASGFGPGEAKVFVRFGSDTLNYYEYRTRLDSANWQDLKIVFEDVTAIKQGRKNPNLRDSVAVQDQPGAYYYVLGTPTLTRITYISVGIANMSDRELTGNVWINELRLLGVDNTPGWAYSISANLKLADLGSVAFSYSNVDPNFHSLEARFGSRTTSRNWNLSANLSLEKFLPMDWAGTSLPFSYSHSESMVMPKYLPGSDIIVEKAAALAKARTSDPVEGQRLADSIMTTSQSLSVTDTYAVPSFKFNVPSSFLLFSELINKMSYGFTYMTSSQRSPTVAFQNTWSWNGRFSYANTLPQDMYLTPFFFVEALKDWRIYYIPVTNFSLSAAANRSRTTSNSRGQADTSISRSLSGGRQFSLGWKGPENGLLNLSGDYSVDISSTMVDFETIKDSLNGKVFFRQRTFSDIISTLMKTGKLFTLGEQTSYSQVMNFNTRPRITDILGVSQFVSMNLRYGVSYRWQYEPSRGDLGKGTGWSNSISFGFDVTPSMLVDKFIPASSVTEAPEETITPQPTRTRGRRDDEEETAPKAPVKPVAATPDTAAKFEPQTGVSLKPAIAEKDTVVKTADSTVVVPQKRKPTFVEDFLRQMISRRGIRWGLTFDKFGFTFTQSNSAQNSGIPGSHGFMNLFGKLPYEAPSAANGASRVYQLGLVSDPTLDLHIEPKSSFPFIRFMTDTIGLRAPNALLSNGFTQSNKIGFRTGHELWPGAHVDFNWSVSWDYSKNSSIKTDSLGQPMLSSVATGGSIERSFFTLFMNNDKWLQSLQNKSDAELPDAFRSLEAMPLLGKFFPRLNYTIRWEGLERLPLLEKVATRVSLEHGYSSAYRETFKGNPSGIVSTESQRINEGFSPLAGVSITFKGNITANVRYGINNSFDLTPSSKNVVQNSTNDISLTGSYAISGFEIPLFGVSLTNDLDFSMSYTFSKTLRKTFPVGIQTVQQTTQNGEGQSRTVLEPRVRYVLSSRVTASVFYRYTKTAPDALGSRIPGSTTNEGGADVHIAIQ